MENVKYNSLKDMWNNLNEEEKRNNNLFEDFTERDKSFANSIVLKLNNKFPKGKCNVYDLYEVGCADRINVEWLKGTRVIRMDEQGNYFFPIIG